MNIIVRSEIESDIQGISDVTRAAFKNHPYSRGTEKFIVKALREANSLTVSLVAVDGKRLVGHIAFSPVTISDGSPGWYGLGPISVLPEFQRQGIGKALMREGLSLLKSLGAKGCVLVGDPGYYKRFGFRSFQGLVVDDVPQENVLALSFEDGKPQGIVAFHDGFNAKC